MAIKLFCLLVLLVHYETIRFVHSSPLQQDQTSFGSTTLYYILKTDNGTEIHVPIRNDGPRPATRSEAQKAVEFFYHRNGQQNGVQIWSRSLTNLEDFVPDAPLYVLCHGFDSNRGFGNQFLEGFRAISSREKINLNVIVIDWGKLAKFPWYVTATHNTGPAGTETACLLRYLINQKLTSLEHIHFIGHSLGSHVGNHVANALNSKCGAGQKIGRITALDPALPLYDVANDRRRLDPDDAEFVDVIHTAIGLLGFVEPRGHVDFYPNAGMAPQPGCENVTVPDWAKYLGLSDIYELFKYFDCSHGRANSYFAESLKNPDAFFGCMCKSWKDYAFGSCPCLEEARMGFGASNTSTRGVYYLKTNEKYPFGQGRNRASGTEEVFKMKKKDHKRERLGILSV